jgi:hypothetical protein
LRIRRVKQQSTGGAGRHVNMGQKKNGTIGVAIDGTKMYFVSLEFDCNFAKGQFEDHFCASKRAQGRNGY